MSNMNNKEIARVKLSYDGQEVVVAQTKDEKERRGITMCRFSKGYAKPGTGLMTADQAEALAGALLLAAKQEREEAAAPVVVTSAFPQAASQPSAASQKPQKPQATRPQATGLPPGLVLPVQGKRTGTQG